MHYFFYQAYDVCIRSNISHRIPVVNIAQCSGHADKHLRGHSAQLEQSYLLAVHLQHAVLGVGQPDEWQVLFLPVAPERLRPLGPDSEYLGIQFREALIIAAQLRHVPAAERSGKPAVKDYQHVFAAGKIRE